MAPSESTSPRSAGGTAPRKRWWVLGAFTGVAGVSQMLWLNFAPILTEVQARYGVSEQLASTLVLVFPLLYVFLSLPAGALIDRRGYRFGVGVGAVLQGAFAVARIFDSSFWVLLAAQVGIAVAQPFILNGITKLVSDWFEEDHSAVATGIGTVGMFLGMAIAMAATPALTQAWSLSGAMAFFAVVAVASTLAFLLLVHERGPTGTSHEPVRWALLARRDLLLLFAISFLGLGFFNGVTTWIEPLLGRNGIGPVGAGSSGAAMIVAGIVGSMLVPTLSDRLRRRKPFVVACATAALVVVYPLGTTARLEVALGMGAALGFFFLPAYALLLEMCAELAGKAHAGMATGVLMLMGNAGGVAVVVAMPLVKGPTVRWSLGPLHLLAGLLVVAVGLALAVRETFGAQRAQRE